MSKLNISPKVFYAGFQYKTKVAILRLPIGHSIKITMHFNEFLSNFERLLNHVKQLKSYFLVIPGDFNARSQSWCLDDMTIYEGPKINSLSTTQGLDQLISQPTSTSNFFYLLMFMNMLL